MSLHGSYADFEGSRSTVCRQYEKQTDGDYTSRQSSKVLAIMYISVALYLPVIRCRLYQHWILILTAPDHDLVRLRIVPKSTIYSLSIPRVSHKNRK